MPMTCSICAHPQREGIDALLATGVLSLRNIAKQYGLDSYSSINRHKQHVKTTLNKAIARKESSAADRLLADVDYLWNESKQYVNDAKSAVKVQRIGDEYREYRDIGAMAAALNQAHTNRRLFGDATGVLAASQLAGASSINLVVVMPRDLTAAAQPELSSNLSSGPAIDCQAIPDPDTTKG